MSKLTTLTQRALTGITVKYKFFKNKITLIIETASDHNLFGEVNIILANVQSINIYQDGETLLEDAFNNTFLFEAVSKTRLEHTFDAVSGFNPQQDLEIILPNNGSFITANVDNLTFDLIKGTYFFKLLDVASKNFDGSFVSVKEKNLVKIGDDNYDGIQEDFDENGDTFDYLSIDGQQLTFHFVTEVSSTVGDTNNTNIPLLVINEQ